MARQLRIGSNGNWKIAVLIRNGMDSRAGCRAGDEEAASPVERTDRGANRKNRELGPKSSAIAAAVQEPHTCRVSAGLA